MFATPPIPPDKVKFVVEDAEHAVFSIVDQRVTGMQYRVL